MRGRKQSRQSTIHLVTKFARQVPNRKTQRKFSRKTNTKKETNYPTGVVTLVLSPALSPNRAHINRVFPHNVVGRSTADSPDLCIAQATSMDGWEPPRMTAVRTKVENNENQLVDVSFHKPGKNRKDSEIFF